MRKRLIVACLAGSLILGAGSALALQCVPYARDTSGIALRGDAWTWWSAAAGQYERGQAPKKGAVVVFKKHGSMRHGHVAVVKSVVNSREVLVDHANWGSRRTGGRGRVATNMAVIDVSRRNDWTEVRVWNRNSDDYGTRTYPTYGFIYPQGPRSAHVRMASAVGAGDQRMMTIGEAVMLPVERDIVASFANQAMLPAPVETKPLASPKAAEPVVVAAIQPERQRPAEVPATAREPAVAALAVAPPQAAPVPGPVAAPPPPPAPAPVAAPAPTPAPAPAVQAAQAPVADGAWEGDAAAAKRFGAGRYSPSH